MPFFHLWSRVLSQIENNVSQDKKIENLTEETENNSEKIKSD